MSPKALYPLEQTCLCSDNPVIHIGEPDSNESPTCQAVQGQGGYKTNPVECAVADHTYWREASESGKPVRGGTGIDTLLRVPSC